MRRRWVVPAALVLIAEIALYRFWSLIDDNDPAPSIEQQLALAAALLLGGLPHLIAWMAHRKRPALLGLAGLLGILLSALSVMGHSLILFTIPFLLIPSVVYLSRALVRFALPGVAVLVIVMTCAIGAGGALFLTEDPRCSILVQRDGQLIYEEPAVCDSSNSGRLGNQVIESSATSDSIALHESLLSLALSGTAIAVCTRTPRNAMPHARPLAVNR